MQHATHPGTSPLTVARRCDIAFNEGKPRPLDWADASLDIGQIVTMSVGEIVQADHHLIEREKLLDQVRTDKSGRPGYEPLLGGPGEVEFKLFVAGGHFWREPC